MKHLKPFRRLLALFFVTLLLGSCTSTAKFSSAKTIDIAPSIIQKPTVADLIVKEAKVTGNFSGKNNIVALETIKNEAVAAALKTVDADILVEPNFETTFEGNFTKVSVSGYPATYKNFRPLKTEDVPLLQLGLVRQVTAFSPPTVTATKTTSGGKKLLGALIIVAIIGAGVSYANANSNAY